MTVAGRSRVYSEDITKLLLVNILQADSSTSRLLPPCG